MRSTDFRFEDAAGDIRQHRVNNPQDWDDDWVFHDERFHVLHADDELFVRFLAEMLHAVVRPDLDEVRRLANTFNETLGRDHWELYEVSQLSGKPIFAGRTRGLPRRPAGAVGRRVPAPRDELADRRQAAAVAVSVLQGGEQAGGPGRHRPDPGRLRGAARRAAGGRSA